MILTRISAGLGQDVADACLVLPTSKLVKIFVGCDMYVLPSASFALSLIPASLQHDVLDPGGRWRNERDREYRDGRTEGASLSARCSYRDSLAATL